MHMIVLASSHRQPVFEFCVHVFFLILTYLYPGLLLLRPALWRRDVGGGDEGRGDPLYQIGQEC